VVIRTYDDLTTKCNVNFFLYSLYETNHFLTVLKLIWWVADIMLMPTYIGMIHQVFGFPFNCSKILWQYRYRLYCTDQHRTDTDSYRYSNGQRFRVYWLHWVISGDIYRTGELWALAGFTAHVTGMLVDRPGTPCVGGGGVRWEPWA